MSQSKKGKYSGRLSNTKKLGAHGSFRTHDSFYRMMVDSLNGYGVFTTDNQGNISSWNTGSEKLFGYKEKEIIGKDFSLIFTDKDRKRSIPKNELKEAKKKVRLSTSAHTSEKTNHFFGQAGWCIPLKMKKGSTGVLPSS